MPLRIAIVSDLHCHHSSSGYSETLLQSDLPRRPENQHPVSALDILIKEEKLTADVLLMPGDMANRCDRQGIMSAWDYVANIGKSLGTTVTASTLGNHDVNWKVTSDDAFKNARELFPLFPSADAGKHQQFWANGFYVEESEDYRVLVVNSVKHHTNEESAKRGLISRDQLDSIELILNTLPPKKYQVALCHHHPIQHEEIDLGPKDLMENGSLFVELLSRKGFDLLVHGHKHHPRLKIETSGGNPLAVFASGSFSAGMRLGLGSRARNVFHIIELSNPADQPKSHGTIRTWQFQHQLGWTKASFSAADFPHFTGFGASSSARELADRIEHSFRALNIQLAHWSTVVQSVPEIERIPPAVFRSVGGILSERGIELYPAAPDRPHCIGIPV